MRAADALYGAWLCGTVLGAVGMALHHKLCHTLGGTFNLPHAETHTVVLPHALAYNRAAAPEAIARIARALGGERGGRRRPAAVRTRARDSARRPRSRDIGMPEERTSTAPSNSRVQTRTGIRVRSSATPMRALIEARVARTTTA